MRLSPIARVAAGSILIGLAVLALKMAAWRVTGSAALYSDALETVVNVAVSGIAFAAIRFAAKPADITHPFGHDKAEFLAAVLEGVLIVGAALSILSHAWSVWWHPHRLEMPGLGIALDLGATLVNAAWATVLFRVARRERSAAMRGDARHLLGDVVTSLGVVLGVALVLITGQLRLDPLVAALTAAYVLWSGLHLIGDSVGGLMDRAPGDDTQARIERILAAEARGALEAHDIRIRQAGRSIFVQFDLVVPGDMRVTEAHQICNRIEQKLHEDMHHLLVNIHVEPHPEAKHEGVVLKS